MCGIAASYNLIDNAGPASAADATAVARMMDRLGHRGPDGRGQITHGRAVLGQTRLAIVDVAGGRQPLTDPERRHYAVGNGEIYNHAALRRRFDGEFRFQTRSDSEVVLPVYRRLGWDGVKALDGMFSYALSDGRGFWAARDPLGIKPLYYGHRNGRMLFASEMGALNGEVDEMAEFPPGHCYTPEDGLRPFYRVPRRTGVVVDPVEAMRIVRRALTEAVHSHLMSDVPVGAFLSGGLDSSLLAMLARREVAELHTFAVGMAGSPDLAAAETVAGAIGSRHHACELTPAMIAEAVEEVVMALESYDAALVRSAVPTWFVARLAAATRTAAGERIKVVLTGEGADELFAGYDYLQSFIGHRLEDELTRLLESLHNLNLQRVDRMTMAHALEARVPFLSTGVVEQIMRIHPVLKHCAAFGQAKGLLRTAFEGDLPSEIIWRQKLEFAQGSSVSTCLGALAAARVSSREWAQAQRDGLPVKSREELFYHRILQQRIRTPLRAGTVGRWQGPVL
jgi:asparagine synthase (glutamine-hydrolysing)